jgi:hypothetical protein
VLDMLKRHAIQVLRQAGHTLEEIERAMVRKKWSRRLSSDRASSMVRRSPKSASQASMKFWTCLSVNSWDTWRG